MGKIIDFPCSYGNSSGVRPEVTEGLGLTFPDAYLHSETMVKLARSLKEKDNAVHCDLSFCHTLEAEAMGGDINLGNDRQGLTGIPRRSASLNLTPGLSSRSSKMTSTPASSMA